MKTEWWMVWDNLITLAYWMDEHDQFEDAQDVIRFFEKPYRYVEEWETMNNEEPEF